MIKKATPSPPWQPTEAFKVFSFVLPLLVLFILTRVNYLVWPPVWPDETLFSNPAATLASSGTFATPVLAGLLPGMEKATLWNSPLYMVLLSFIYKFTGESLTVARWFSFSLAGAALIIFQAMAARLFRTRYLPLLLTLLLALDPTFHRAANTARMDILALIFLFTCMYSLISARALWTTDESAGARPRVGLLYFLAGISTGLAGLSHPIGVILVPMVLIFALPSPRNVAAAGLGALAAFSPWLFYILPNWELFQLQFFSQLQRKSEFLRLSGGDTGGFLLVYASQYAGLWSGSRFSMLAALLMIAITGLGGLLFLHALTGGTRGLLAKTRAILTAIAPTHIFPRLFLTWGTLTMLILMASEAWYAVYVGPLVLLTAGLMAEGAMEADASGASLGPLTRRLLAVPLVFAGLFFLISTGRHMIHHQAERTADKIRRYNAAVLPAARGCRVLYTRSTPDPYFLLRAAYPRMEILEFIPGKLLKPAWLRGRGIDIEKRLRRRYAGIDCFLLDENHAWEPFLTPYLKENRAAFKLVRIPADRPLPGATLYRRTPGNIGGR